MNQLTLENGQSCGFKITHAAQNCNEYNHNVTHNLVHLTLNIPKNDVAINYFFSAFIEITKPLHQSLMALHALRPKLWHIQPFQISC